MRFFTRKKSNPNPSFIPPPPVEKKCEHKFQDFPWFLTWDLQYNRYTIKVIEPYVCIFAAKGKIKSSHLTRAQTTMKVKNFLICSEIALIVISSIKKK